MSGYLQKRLSLVGVNLSPAALLKRTRHYLSEHHNLHEPSDSTWLIELRSSETGDWEYEIADQASVAEIESAVSLQRGIHISQSIRIGKWDYDTFLFLYPAGEFGVGLEWKIGSAPFDAVFDYDRSLERFDDDAKKGLLHFCLGAAAAANSVGFLLTADEPSLLILSPSRLVQEMELRTLKWSLAGAHYTLLTRQELQRRKKLSDPKGLYSTTGGFTVRDLIHPVIY